jgi:hypothetical protein
MPYPKQAGAGILPGEDDLPRMETHL